MGAKKPTVETFWQRVEKTDSCWLWKGSLRGNGYGKINWEGVRTPAHRVAYMIAVGPIPTGMHVMHSCDVPACVNPEHLSLGSRQDNMLDKVAKGRANVPFGDRHRETQVTSGARVFIRGMKQYHESGDRRRLADSFGVAQSCIRFIQDRPLPWSYHL